MEFGLDSGSAPATARGSGTVKVVVAMKVVAVGGFTLGWHLRSSYLDDPHLQELYLTAIRNFAKDWGGIQVPPSTFAPPAFAVSSESGIYVTIS